MTCPYVFLSHFYIMQITYVPCYTVPTLILLLILIMVATADDDDIITSAYNYIILYSIA